MGLPFHSPFFGPRSLQLRAATAAEVKRCCQQQALQDAHDTGDYDELHAQLMLFPLLVMFFLPFGCGGVSMY